MPQIAQLSETFASQIFWMLLIFGLVFFVVGRGMVPRVLDTVGLRDRQIADDLAGAEAARSAADLQEQDWRARDNAARAEARALIQRAQAEAQAAAGQRMGAAQERLDKALQGAETRIAEASARAADELEQVAASAARDIVERLAGIALDEAAARDAVRKVMAHG